MTITEPSSIVGTKCIHRAPIAIVRGGKIVRTTEDRDVRVMAICEGYAMIRRPRAMPYVCCAKELVNTDIPQSFKDGIMEIAEGKVVDMEKALRDEPPEANP